MERPDKFLLEWQGKSLLAHCIERAMPQVDELVISANGDPQRLGHENLTVLADRFAPPCGPLGGVLTAMAWAWDTPGRYHWVASFASDTPRFPLDAVAAMRELAEAGDLQVAYPVQQGRAHYTFALWSLSAYPALLKQFEAGERALWRCIKGLRQAPWSCEASGGSFHNVNTLADWQDLLHTP